MLKKSKQLLVVILSMMVCSCSEKESGNAGGGENGNPDLEPVITGGYSYDGYEKIIGSMHFRLELFRCMLY